MKIIMMTISEVMILSLVFLFQMACKKEVNDKTGTGFVLTSMAIGADSLLPADYTCQGSSSTLPLHWTGAPSGTVSFVLIMHHEASPTDIHCYWILYNIPADVDILPRNVTGIGTFGINSVNDKMQYTPPCSQGPGLRDYILTLYALSQKPVIDLAPDSVDRPAMLNAIKDITISSTKMTVYYVWNKK
jgi:phosphatidylethanolamine-binding protein (PEBP) family uncharacterized protein